MQKVLILATCSLLAACGEGLNDIDYARLGMTGVNNSVTRPVEPSGGNGSTDSSNGLWEYSQSGSSRFAQMKSLNTIPTANERNNAIMLVQIQNFTNSQGVAADYLTITVLFAPTMCASSCSLRYKKDGGLSGVYTVRESVEGVFSENSFSGSDMQKLIKAIKMSGRASISVPLLGVPDAEFEFDFSGYDPKLMGAK